jgi:hypothetical protein
VVGKKVDVGCVMPRYGETRVITVSGDNAQALIICSKKGRTTYAASQTGHDKRYRQDVEVSCS